jgi:carboxyl-terminal processing protease
VFFWKLPHFATADRGIGKVVGRARKHEVLILDLRGNYGGVMKTLEKLVGYFTDQPVEVGTLHMRWDTERFHAKPKTDRFTGQLFILVDSETASAAEVFTRMMQISGRAKVIGDRTMGAVMASMYWEFEVGDGWWSGASITVSDFVLHNGERLEKIGVEPDVKIVPTAQDIAAGVDPVLAYALKETGIPMTSAQAARLITGK